MLPRIQRWFPSRAVSRQFWAGPPDVLRSVSAVKDAVISGASLNEDQRTQGHMIFRDGMNQVFKTLEVPLQVDLSQADTSLYADLSESGLRRRLDNLKAEVLLIEKYLAEGLTSTSNPGTAPAAVEPVPVAVEPTVVASVLDSEEGEEYLELDRLTRQLKKWYTVDSCTETPYQMMSTFELYPQWIPWCLSGRVLSTHPTKGVSSAAVGFGIKVPFLGTLGDDIVYRVELEPPTEPHGVARVYTVSDQSRYMDRLVYDWRFVPVSDSRTRVILNLEFKAAAAWCTPIWESLRRDVVNNISSAFIDRIVLLQASQGGDRSRPLSRPQLASVTSVLQGPMLRDQAVVVTETNGRTIRHANAAFARLAGRPLEGLPGKDIPDLLQDVATDRTVLRALGSAIRSRLPATVVLRNRNMAGDRFLNRLSLAPLDDDERNTGVVFWAVLKVVQGVEQRLELSELGALDEAWGPDYEHPQTISGRDMLTQSK